jgi:hypothetical protein
VLDDGTLFRKVGDNQTSWERMVFGVNDGGGVYVVGYWREGVDNREMYSVSYLENASNSGDRFGRFMNNLQSNDNYTNKNGWNFVNNNGSIIINKST